jgi:hypothetical protein
MPSIYDKKYTKPELLKRVGDISQVAGVRFCEIADGLERGVRALEFYTGAGFRFTVLVDRAMDISSAEYKGASLVWRSANGDVSPFFYKPQGCEWLRTFQGGLVTTCGLTYLGAPCVDEGELYGLHGRISSIPAGQISYGGKWKGDEYLLFAEGTMIESIPFAEYLSLTRRITAKLGESRLFIEDIVENRGFNLSPLMVLYHCNLGFPLVDGGSELIARSSKVIPRDDDAKGGLQDWNLFENPSHQYKEQVFYHEMIPDEDGHVSVAIVNRAFHEAEGIGVYIKYMKHQLPKYIEWKQMGEGTYVVGCEPANCLVEGRAKERESGSLQFIQPGEKREFALEVGVLDGKKEITEFKKMLGR